MFFVFGRTPTLNADAAPGAEIEFSVEVEKDGVSVWRDTFAIVVAGAPTAVADFAALPEDFALGYSFPNPFNAATTIRYHLPHEALVDLSVFNAAGQPVRQLVDKTKAAGTHRAVWAGRDDGGHALATGVLLLPAGRRTLPADAADGPAQIA
ncbi:MAG: FlgD immunoglobulin-like domain containing protein [Candidatus Latescibacterota bacterium]|nr:FlgD immunoglobulin-like domain containing protein [Candidatus Latescibacterota bacterium]